MDEIPWAERLQAAIQQKLGNQIRELLVILRRDSLVLRGRTRTFHAKQVALQVVLDASCPLPLVNEIVVGTG